MKKAICISISLLLVLLTSCAFAAGKLSTTQENFWVISGWTTYAYAYAKVENVGNKPIKVNAGVLEVYDENGDVITSNDYINAHARYLQPNEYTYATINSRVELAENVGKPDDYMMTITGKTDDSGTTIRLPVEGKLSLDEGNGWSKRDYVYATVTNNTEEIAYGISVVFAVLDSDGNILYVGDDDIYSSRGLTSGSSIVFKMEISSSHLEYFDSKGIKPVSVDVIAYINK